MTNTIPNLNSKIEKLRLEINQIKTTIEAELKNLNIRLDNLENLSQSKISRKKTE